MSIYPRKQLMIIAENCITGMDKLPEGYQVEDIEIYPETVEITGTAERLEGLTSLPSEVIDIAGKSEDVYTTIQLLVPDGITLTSGTDTVSLIIRISEIIEKTVFEDLTVELRNIPAGLDVEDFEELRTVELLVPSNTAETLTASHVKPYIDLAELSAGEHELRIQCEVPEEFRATEIEVLNDTATVILVEYVIINDVKVSVDYTNEEIKKSISKKLNIKPSRITDFDIIRRSIDARYSNVRFSLSINATIKGEDNSPDFHKYIIPDSKKQSISKSCYYRCRSSWTLCWTCFGACWILPYHY